MTSKILATSIVLALSFSACSSTTTNRAPSSSSASPICEETQLNQECYAGGSAEAEEAQFQQFAEMTREIMDRQSREHNPGKVLRAVHAKNHACFSGTFHIYDQNDPRTRYGVFAEGGKNWSIWTRFSNGVGWSRPDRDPDLRGFAIKLMDVPGPKLGPVETQTQDFILINTPIPVGGDAAQFMQFAEANSKGTLNLAEYIANVMKDKVESGFGPEPIDGLTKPLPPASLATLRYWSGSAFRMGDHQAVKFQIAPKTCDFDKMTVIGDAPKAGFPKIFDSNYLTTDIVKRAKSGLCYEFYVQFQANPQDTPVENPLIEWKESVSPKVPVGLILLPPQEYRAETDDLACDQLSFNPWHAVEAHRPLGNVNRARKLMYQVSRDHRSP